MNDCPLSTLVAVTGGSGSGKSWLVGRLHLLFGKKAGCISQDDFYRDRSHLSPVRREKLNFDRPEAIDWRHFEHVLRELAAGRSALLPQYDFHTHCQLDQLAASPPRPVILVDGLWLLHRPSVRRLFHYKIYVQCPEKIRRQRRQERDVSERGRTVEECRRVFRERVLPMHRRFVAPQRNRADLILGYPLTEAAFGRVYERVREFAESPHYLTYPEEEIVRW